MKIHCHNKIVPKGSCMNTGALAAARAVVTQGGLSPNWALFGSGHRGHVNSVASQMHGGNGDYWFAWYGKLQQSDFGYTWRLVSSVSGPFLRIGRNSVDDSQYRLRASNFVYQATDQVPNVYNSPATEVLVCWSTEDTGTHARLRVMVDGVITDFGANSELRSAMTTGWPPSEAYFGGFSGDLVGHVGWIGAGQGQPHDDWAAIYAAFGGDRRNLSDAFNDSSSVTQVTYAQVLDGESGADFGPDITWVSAPTFEEP